MSFSKPMAAAALAVALSAFAASAQTGGLTNGASGTRPDALGSDRQSGGINAAQPSRAIMNPHSSMYNSGAQLLRKRPRRIRH